MSYRQRYTGYVRYSGTVDYPPSQNGGSQSYSGEIPVNIEIDVDTSTFDHSVDVCNDSIKGLTTAVIATEAAQVESKRVASDKIAKSIVKGFFDYVGAELSQKMKELSSKCESLFIALMGHKDNCLAKRGQMEGDYHRITRRYLKIFEDLDKETVSRIEILDKPTFQFVDEAQKVIDRNADSKLLGIAAVSSGENLALETVLSCSHVKRQANELLSKADAYLSGTYRLAAAVRDMLDDGVGGSEIFLPVMYVESVSSKGGLESRVYGPGESNEPFGKDIDPKLVTAFGSKEMKWRNIPNNEYDRIASYLNSDVIASGLDERTIKTIWGLIEGHVIQTINA